MTTYTIAVPAAVWLTANKQMHYQARSKAVHTWRRNVVAACERAGLPTGITPVRITAAARYLGRTSPVRDRLNLAPTIKAVVDGLTPHKVKIRAGRQVVSEGYGLLPDDSDAHVLDTTWHLERLFLTDAYGQPGRVGELVLTIHHIGDPS